MDKIERIIDMTEHPERYTEDELRQLLIDDDEGNRIYKTISELNVAFNMDSGMRLSQKTKKYHLELHIMIQNLVIYYLTKKLTNQFV